ncbi:MAG: aroA [Flaviaesturariibacter sp.]|nr:aroA [Flaviaesturariibacter sp.]
MQAIVSPSRLSGMLTAPASKSSMQRACAAALLKGGCTILDNPGVSDDDRAALGIIGQLGATVRKEGDTIVIESGGIRPEGGSIHCGESGLSVRMFTSIAALCQAPVTITGSGSLLKRPLSFFNEVLPQLGVLCESANGFLPLRVTGPLKPRNITVDGSLSSQFLTGVLMAYSASGASGTTISVTNLNSKPYIDLTLKVMADFGLPVPVNHDYKEFTFGDDVIRAGDVRYQVEGDWSGGAFLLVAGALAGSLDVDGLDVFSTQADKAILQALSQAGAGMSVQEGLIAMRQAPLKEFHVNATDCPDLFPPLVALASRCPGRSVIEGVHRLAHKESNRALTLQEEFGKMGVGIQLQDDLMVISGGEAIRSATVSSHHDHRIAMACAVAALNADGPVTITGAEAVDKSYPHFWQHLQRAGASVSLTDH